MIRKIYFIKTSLLCLCWFYFLICSATFELSRDYAYSKQLVDGYVMRWSIVKERTLHLAIEVNTLGWIGFGIGELSTGSMAGADMITGFVNSSGGFITDRWAKSLGVQPEDDVCQDWTLLSFSEDSQTGKTLLELSRALVTEDTRQDRPILDNGFPTRILGAWGASDTFGIHETKFLGRINFFADPSEDVIDKVKQKAKLESNIIEWTLTNGDYHIPPVDTVYYEFCRNLTEIKHEVHLVAINPQFDVRSNGSVHHFLIFGHQELDCKGPRQLVYMWSLGTGPFVYPDDVGLRIGGEPGSTVGFHSMYMQTHFDNPSKLEGLVDDSGIGVVATTKLRKHDAGILMLGDPDSVLRGKKLIPGRSRYVFDCPPSCTRDLRGNITVFKTFHHMHTFGRRMYTSVIRRGRPLGTITSAEFFLQTMQEAAPIEPFTIMPSDHLKATCFYETDGTVRFGHKTQLEMCIQFLYYYPMENIIGHGNCGLGSCGTMRRPTNVEDFGTAWGKPPRTCATKPAESMDMEVDGPSQTLFDKDLEDIHISPEHDPERTEIGNEMDTRYVANLAEEKTTSVQLDAEPEEIAKYRVGTEVQEDDPEDNKGADRTVNGERRKVEGKTEQDDNMQYEKVYQENSLETVEDDQIEDENMGQDVFNQAEKTVEKEEDEAEMVEVEEEADEEHKSHEHSEADLHDLMSTMNAMEATTSPLSHLHHQTAPFSHIPASERDGAIRSDDEMEASSSHIPPLL